MIFQKGQKTKSDFTKNQQDQLYRLNENLKDDFVISWKSFKSFYLIDEENQEEIARFSNHSKKEQVDYFNFVSQDFKSMINDFKKFTEQKGFIKIQWSKFRKAANPKVNYFDDYFKMEFEKRFQRKPKNQAEIKSWLAAEQAKAKVAEKIENNTLKGEHVNV